MRSFKTRYIDNSDTYDLATVVSSCYRQLREFKQQVEWNELYKFYGSRRNKALKLTELATQTILENHFDNPFNHLAPAVEKDVTSRFIHAKVFLKNNNKYQESNMNWDAFCEIENTGIISSE